MASFGIKPTPEALPSCTTPSTSRGVSSAPAYGPVFNSIAAFERSLAWRGFLWPRLAPDGVLAGLHRLRRGLGPVARGDHRADGLSTIRASPVLGLLMMCAWVTMLGAWMNWLFSKTGSSILAAWVHGVFNSQGYGIWRALTWPVNNLVGGFTGINRSRGAGSIPAIWLAGHGGRIRAVDAGGERLGRSLGGPPFHLIDTGPHHG